MSSAMDTANAARGRWPGILQALGIDGKFLTDRQGPCPICGGDTRFRFPDELNGNWFCNKCYAHGSTGPHDGFELLQRVHGWDFKKAAAEVDGVVGNIPIVKPQRPEMSDSDKAKACRKLLQGAGKVAEETPAWRYLMNRCGRLDPSSLGDLRSHPGIKHTTSGGIHPAMLGVMRYANGSGASVHRTYLTHDGFKANVDPVRKMMPGLPLAGACVRIGPLLERIGIAEGIETAICASNHFGLPVWAATCAGQLKVWDPPDGVREVVIFADNDENFVGYDAAMDLGKRLRRLGIEWEIKMPTTIGQDWADVCSESHLQQVS